MDEQIITYEGKEWRVLSTGNSRDGTTFCHLASVTEGRQQRNGWNPVQICDWVPSDLLEAQS